MRGIALNFFPLITDDFTVTLYRYPYVESSRPEAEGRKAIQRNLEVEGERGTQGDVVELVE